MTAKEIHSFGEKFDFPPLLTFNFKLSKERRDLISLIQNPKNLDIDKVDNLLNAANSNDIITASVALEFIDSIYIQLSTEAQLLIFEFIKKSFAKLVKSSPVETTKIIAFYFPDDFQNELNELASGDFYRMSSLAVEGILNRSDKNDALQTLLSFIKKGNLNENLERRVAESIYKIDPNVAKGLSINSRLTSRSKEQLNTLIYFDKFFNYDGDFSNFIQFIQNNELDTSTSASILSKLGQIDEDRYSIAIDQLDKSESKNHKMIAGLAKWEKSQYSRDSVGSLGTKEASPFLFNKKSLYSTPFKQELSEKIADFGKILQKLKESLGDQVIGIQLHGSLADGHWRPTSDNDVSIITSSNSAIKSFNEVSESNGIRLDPFSSGINISELDKLGSTSIATLFSGVFIGDKKAFQKIQLKILQNIDDDLWEEVRKQIYSLMVFMQVDKMYDRMGPFDFSRDSFRMIKKLTKVPGTRSECLQVLSRALV